METMRNLINLVEGNEKLTDQEQEIINHLAEAYNLFVDLPNQHQNDQEEFSRYIHILQRHVMSRVARRMHPEMFGKTE